MGHISSLPNQSPGQGRGEGRALPPSPVISPSLAWSFPFLAAATRICNFNFCWLLLLSVCLQSNPRFLRGSQSSSPGQQCRAPGISVPFLLEGHRVKEFQSLSCGWKRCFHTICTQGAPHSQCRKWQMWELRQAEHSGPCFRAGSDLSSSEQIIPAAPGISHPTGGFSFSLGRGRGLGWLQRSETTLIPSPLTKI